MNKVTQKYFEEMEDERDFKGEKWLTKPIYSD